MRPVGEKEQKDGGPSQHGGHAFLAGDSSHSPRDSWFGTLSRCLLTQVDSFYLLLDRSWMKPPRRSPDSTESVALLVPPGWTLPGCFRLCSGIWPQLTGSTFSSQVLKDLCVQTSSKHSWLDGRDMQSTVLGMCPLDPISSLDMRLGHHSA